MVILIDGLDYINKKAVETMVFAVGLSNPLSIDCIRWAFLILCFM